MKGQLIVFIFIICPICIFCQNGEFIGGISTDSMDLTFGKIKNVADPISPQDAATKAYVDSIKFFI